MGLKRLSLADQGFFRRFLAARGHRLSAYAFESIAVWRALYTIRWKVIDGNLCVFFQDAVGKFLFLPPLGKSISEQAVTESFAVMDAANRNPAVSRIENIEQPDTKFFHERGYTCRHGFDEYLCLRRQLARLAGDTFKSKRASVNYFTKHYQWAYAEFRASDAAECIRLYQHWMRNRRSHIQDTVYRGMLDDSFACLAVLLRDYRRLRMQGRVVRVGAKLAGFTFGFAVTDELFCVLYEITDLSYKGISQFIFQRFCQELKPYTYITLMDDSGLANLKRVKESYRPISLTPSFTATRTDAA